MARVSTSFKWTLRVLVWGVAALMIFPLYRTGVAYTSIALAQNCMASTGLKGHLDDSLYFAQRFSLCMFLGSSYLESRRQEPALRDVMAMEAPPCEFVGIWKSARRKSVYRLTLKDDGRFTGEEMVDYGPTGGSEIGGFWGEHAGRMVWIHNDGAIWPPDINPIEARSEDKFTLVEVNGERTEFTLERRLDSERCPSA